MEYGFLVYGGIQEECQVLFLFFTQQYFYRQPSYFMHGFEQS